MIWELGITQGVLVHCWTLTWWTRTTAKSKVLSLMMQPSNGRTNWNKVRSIPWKEARSRWQSNDLLRSQMTLPSPSTTTVTSKRLWVDQKSLVVPIISRHWSRSLKLLKCSWSILLVSSQKIEESRKSRSRKLERWKTRGLSRSLMILE